MGRDRNDQGRYSDRIPPEDVLEVFADRDDRARPLTAADVVDALGIARRTAHNKLNRLVERGELATRKVGARGRVWWVPLPGDDVRGESDREPPATPSDAGAGDTAGRDAGGREHAQTAPGATARDDVDQDPIGDALDGWRPGRSPGEKREQQRAAGRAALEYLRGRSVATAAEFREDVAPEHPVDGQSPDTWWKNTARPALNRARDAGVVEFKDGVKEWRWVA